MAKEIMIDPVTRIEGHAKITIQLGDDGQVQDAHFHVTQVRGFEKFVEGRPFHEMPSLMARICGICPVSHLIASARACDQLLSVHVPPTGKKLRRILNMAQIIQSHALSFFYLSSPDLLMGMDADPANRNLVGVLQAEPQIARDGVRLRQMGQQIIEIMAGKRIHPSWVVPGGVNAPLTAEQRDRIVPMVTEGTQIAQRTLEWFAARMETFAEEIATFANFPTLFMSLSNAEGTLEMYDGPLRFSDADGNVVAENIPVTRYADYVQEAVLPHSYLKAPYFKANGHVDSGIYRVGPLARLNNVKRPGTPLADAAFPAYQQLDRNSSFHYHYARLIEILYCFEKIGEILNDPEILDTHVRAVASPNAQWGVGASEAPRGTLMHEYEIDRNGLMTRANLMIATGHNALAMDKGVLQVARHFIKGESIQEGMLNRVEAVIRAYDPCLSCSTHAVGQMALHVTLHAPNGELLDEVIR